MTQSKKQRACGREREEACTFFFALTLLLKRGFGLNDNKFDTTI
jgi:hypothetical protein